MVSATLLKSVQVGWIGMERHLRIVSRLPSLTYEHNQENNSCVIALSPMVYIKHGPKHTKAANPLGKPHTKKLSKGHSPKQSKTFEEKHWKKLTNKHLRSQQVWGGWLPAKSDPPYLLRCVLLVLLSMVLL